MRKQKDWSWGLTPDSAGQFTYDQAILSVLMDIRDELKDIRNRVGPLNRLDCPNFLAIPGELAAIRRNTTKKKRPKGKPKLRVVA